MADRARGSGAEQSERRRLKNASGEAWAARCVPETFPAQSGAPAAMYQGSCNDSGVNTSLKVAPTRMLLLFVNAGPVKDRADMFSSLTEL